MTTLEQKIRIARPNIKDITLNNYVRSIKIVIKRYTNLNITNFTTKYLTYFNDSKKFLKWLDKVDVADSTKAAYLFSVITLLSLEKNKYNNVIKDYQFFYKNRIEALKKTPMNEQETLQWTTMNNLIEKTKQLSKDIKTFKKHRNYVIASLHTLQTPRRNIARTLFITNKKPEKNSEKNWLVLSTPSYFVYDDQKVSKYNGETVKINKNLENILKNYITKYNLKNNEVLLPTKQSNNTIMTTGAYTKLLKTYLGVSSSMIRKIYVSENTKPQITDMGNSTATQYNHYKKK